ncbi:MAG: glycerol kinase, partial [Lachnospiraceae bacterium]|nr:glycerol kinase [Lachnospiraceae bacterium]
PTGNAYLMQLQSDFSDVAVSVSQTEELSAMGAVLLAGLGYGLYSETQLNSRKEKAVYAPKMAPDRRNAKLERWQKAVAVL